MKFSCDALKKQYELLNRKPHIYDLCAVLEYDFGDERLVLECYPYDLYEWLVAVRGLEHKEEIVKYESDMGDGFSLSLEFKVNYIELRTDSKQYTISEIELDDFIEDLRGTIVLLLKEWYSAEDIQAIIDKYL